MKKKMTYHEPRYRLLKAVAVVLAILLSAPGVDVVVRLVTNPEKASAVNGDGRVLDSSALLDAQDAFGSLERIEGAAQASNREPSQAFFDEVGFLAGAQDVRVSSTGDVVGYVVDEDCEEAFDRLCVHMEALGWTAIPLGAIEGATFVKSSGAITWALVTCTHAGDGTSVVVRCALS